MNKTPLSPPFTFFSSRGRSGGARARRFGPGGRSNQGFSRGVFCESTDVAAGLVPNPKPRLYQYRAYARLRGSEFRAPVFERGVRYFPSVCSSSMRRGTVSLRRFWGTPPPNNQQFVGCQPSAVAWLLERHYYNQPTAVVRDERAVGSGFISLLFQSDFRFLFPPSRICALRVTLLSAGVHRMISTVMHPSKA